MTPTEEFMAVLSMRAQAFGSGWPVADHARGLTYMPDTSVQVHRRLYNLTMIDPTGDRRLKIDRDVDDGIDSVLAAVAEVTEAAGDPGGPVLIGGAPDLTGQIVDRLRAVGIDASPLEP